MTATAERIGTLLCGVGESPVWRAADQAFYWTDIPGRALWRWHPSSNATTQWELPQMAGCIAMRGAGWLLAMEDGIYACDALQAGAPCIPKRLCSVAHSAPGMRFNDGRCDRQGRLLAGTMVMDMSLAAPAGRLYRYGAQALTVLLDDLVVPNGMAFSPDGKTMYLSDSHPSRSTVWAFDYDTDTGTPHNRRVFIPALPAGRPDGAAVDAEGGYWICGNEAGRIYRYTPTGQLDRTLTVPAARIAMCAFGGAGMDTLFVTSIRPVNAAPDSLEGAVFALHPGTQGLEETASTG
ncbi:SMP-30/gluconolactonase/LRE family protein [Achromobacter seleniivolatilans]|uniref:SMP-30/gluconolactonase/LRE family protein n=1 Tax=Achromobacter seleniivolatilans TaxID=3047478 RepID=A0ABY9M0H7_9BURK|nr:SMP-30/gluconolactonase/LRE family protein [Achromobacter sp. R39]WMD20118.1 SMP-30/gluconolactonase/LRE family protein [Achromobacter sp. R39]